MYIGNTGYHEVGLLFAESVNQHGLDILNTVLEILLW